MNNRMMKKTICCLAIIAGLNSCHDNSKIVAVDKLPAERNLISAPAVTAAEVPASAQTQQSQPRQDTVVYDTVIYPKDTSYLGKILTADVFHEDEVWDGVANEAWWGIFKEEGRYFLTKTSIFAERVHDPVMDEDMELDKTGWKITAGTEKPILLMAGFDFQEKQNFESAALKEHIFPGDTLTIQFMGQEYRLHASGEKEKATYDENWYRVWNYKLYLSTQKGGQTLTQLLVAQPTFDDVMADIIFAGDMDGDGRLDLLLDASNNYNTISPTLYLSKPAEEAEHLKVGGRHISVGC